MSAINISISIGISISINQLQGSCEGVRVQLKLTAARDTLMPGPFIEKLSVMQITLSAWQTGLV